MTVLVVDDSAAVRTRVVALLREAGLDVIAEADTAAGALELARTLHPDAIVLDLHLPDKNGMQIIPDLKACTPPPVIAILTGAGHPEYRTRCLALGADHYLDKSKDFDRIAALLRAR